MLYHVSNLFFGIGIVFVYFFIYAMIKKRSRNGSLFALMCMAVAIFIIGYSLELRSTTIEQLQVCLKLEYFGAPFMTVFWFMFSYKFFYNRHVSFKLGVFVMVVPILTLFFNVSNDYFHLLYKQIDYRPSGDFIVAVLTRGPWYYFYSLYSYAIILYGCFLFFKVWKISNNQMIKTQSFLMFSGTVIPVICNILYLAGFTPGGMDITPFGLLALANFYGLALFKYDVLELKEIVKSVVFEEIDEAILVVDNKNRLIEYNEAAEKVFDWMHPDHIGIDIRSFEYGNCLVDQENPVFIMQVITETLNRYYEFRVSILQLKNEVVGRVIFFRDVTLERQMVEKLDQLASYDALSQVYNRRKLLEEADKEAIRAMRYYDHLSVLMIDIDHFKNVNDQFGHLAGDEVIFNVAQMIKRKIRSIDIVGRYGGEEFVAVLSNADKDSGLRVAESIRREISEMKILYGEETISVTVSVGLAVVNVTNQRGINIMAMINLADKAMYCAKEKGRNRVEEEIYEVPSTLRMTDENL